MIFWTWIFTISCFLVVYNYAGYAFIAWCLTRLFGKHKPAAASALPSVSFIVAAYDEETDIEQKIRNSIQQDYPSDRIEFLFVTDGSTDRTPALIRNYPIIRLLHQPGRNGKSAAVNRAVNAAKNDILIFSDANTILNPKATFNIARHYANIETGGVAGEKKVLPHPDSQVQGDGEGLYWKYESLLKKIDSDFYSVVGAAGELFSVRRDLYEALPEDTILDDFVLSLKVAEKGFRIIYEPEAFASELPSFSLKDEGKRKIRIAAGGFQSMARLKGLLMFWRHPRLSFLYISHRVLRWTLSPLCLLLALISNSFLYLGNGNGFFRITFWGQIVFYGLALLSRLPLLSNNKLGKIARVPYYFTFMNVSVLLGFFRWLKGNQSAVWEKARRAENQP